jgi:hypothetical protein
MPTIVNGLAFGEVFFSGEFGEVGVFDLGWPGEVLEATFIAVERFFTGGFVCEFLARGGEEGVVIDFPSFPGLFLFFFSLSINSPHPFYSVHKLKNYLTLTMTLKYNYRAILLKSLKI